MYGVFRFLIVILSLVTSLTSIFAFVGSYKNEDYLTKIYLLDFHLTKVKLSALFDISNFSKRDFEGFQSFDDQEFSLGGLTPSGTINDKRAISSSTASQIAADVSSLLSTVSYSDLGLAEVYSISFWGYCKGEINGNSKDEKGFDNSNIKFTWCSKPKAGFVFDPLTIFKDEINSSINNSSLDSDTRSGLKELVDNLSYSTLNLPGDLKSNLKVLNNLTKAGFALILITAVVSTLYAALEFVGMLCSPSNVCLSICSSVIQIFIFLVSIIGAGIITGAYIFVRKEINNNTSEYGIKSFLSIAFYALIWSAVASSLITLLVSFVGRCCSCCACGQPRYRNVQQAPEMGYYHQESAPFLEKNV